MRVWLVVLTLASFAGTQVRAQDVSRPAIQLRISTTTPGETWFAQHGDAEPVRLCTAPCTLKIKADTLRFGTAMPSEAFPTVDERALTLRESVGLSAQRISHRGRRIAGVALALTSVVFGLAGFVGGALGDSYEGQKRIGGGTWAWLGLNVITFGAGVGLMFSDDEVHVKATPLSAPEPDARAEPSAAAGARS